MCAHLFSVQPCCQLYRSTVGPTTVRESYSYVYVQPEEHICNYGRDRPCVGLRDAVETNELLVQLGVLSHPSNDDDCLLAILWDEQKRPKVESSECIFIATVSSRFQKEYRQNI